MSPTPSPTEPLRALLIDGHPDRDRLSAHLLDTYQAALPAGTGVARLAIRDLDFDPDLRRGYEEIQELEPDLERALSAIEGCDHLVLAFPLWWGAEPARLKGFFDRAFLPGRAFRDHEDDPMWDRLLVGRSADLIVTLDTPGWFLRTVWLDAPGRRLRNQVLGFVGFSPVRLFYCGTVKQGAAERNLPRWRERLGRAARSAPGLRRRARP